MSLINYRGLNCHLACAINIAHSLGVKYKNAFSTLWSETDFFDDLKYHIYSSKRILPNLEAVGAKMEVLNCASHKEAAESFSLIPPGELFIVGMDTFYIPWSPVYQNFYEPHFFIAQKDWQGSVFCFDPTYNQNNLRLMSADIAPYAFDLSRIRKLPVNPQPFFVSQEAKAILRKHPQTQEKLCMEIQKCKDKEQEDIAPLIKQINAMINNRYLFQRFLHQYPFSQDRQFFNKSFFSKWEAVKNGIYKAHIIRNNESVVDEVCNLFLALIREETDMAKEMVMIESGFGGETSSAPVKPVRQ